MPSFNISQAAKLTGKARSTIQRDIKTGKLSATHGDNGTPVIDASELIRVYGKLKASSSHQNCSDVTHDATPKSNDDLSLEKVQQGVAGVANEPVATALDDSQGVLVSQLESEIEHLRERLKDLEEDRVERRNREKKLHDQLEKILEISSGQERRLLTYERQEETPEKKKGLLARVFSS